jgi:hypothetical protein
MLETIHEAGWVAWIIVTIALVSAAVVVARRRRGESLAGAAATLTLALSLANASVGQAKVDAAVTAEPDPALQLIVLSHGTREASRNLMVGGTCATLLLALGGAVSALTRSREKRS